MNVDTSPQARLQSLSEFFGTEGRLLIDAKTYDELLAIKASAWWRTWPGLLAMVRSTANEFGASGEPCIHNLAMLHERAVAYLCRLAEPLGIDSGELAEGGRFAREVLRVRRELVLVKVSTAATPAWPDVLGQRRYELSEEEREILRVGENAFHRLVTRLEISESSLPEVAVHGAKLDLPIRKAETGELLFGGKVVKEIKNLGTAINAIAILNAFQEEGWPTRIDDPLPGGKNPQRLNDVIKNSLNRKLSVIKFRSDGSGTGIRWEVVL